MVYLEFVVISALTTFLFLLSYLDVTFGVDSERCCPHICCFILKLLVFSLLLCDGSDYHFTCQAWERRRDVDVLLRTNSIGIKEAIAHGEFSNAVICLIEGCFCCTIWVFREQVDLIGTKNNRYRSSVDLNYFVHFLFPLCCVLDRFLVCYISYHDNSLRLAAEVSIKAFVCGIHSN